MRIGIDIDGVLTNVEQFEIEYGSKFYFENTSKHLVNPNGYGSKQIFNGSQAEDNLFWGKAIYDYIKYPARDFASEVIKKLKNDGNEIYIVTARTSDLLYCDISTENMKEIVIDWLNRYNIIYDNIVWTGKDKKSECEKNKIDIMIDDSPKHINALSEFIPVICYDARYNKMCNGKNILRCYSWYDIYDKILALKQSQNK